MAALELASTDQIQHMLACAAASTSISEDLQLEAKRYKDAPAVPWQLVKQVTAALRTASAAGDGPLALPTEPDGTGPWLQHVCHGSSLMLHSPAPRERSAALTARLAELQVQVDNKRYADMVSDITTVERKAEDQRNSALLPTFRLQLGFGMHVLVTMFTFFAICYYGSKMYLSFNETWAGLMGVIGITFALLMETFLLIIRTNRPTPLEERMPELFDPKLYNRAFELNAAARKARQTSGSRHTSASSSTARGGSSVETPRAGSVGSSADGGVRAKTKLAAKSRAGGKASIQTDDKKVV